MSDFFGFARIFNAKYREVTDWIADAVKFAESSRLFLYNGVFTWFGLLTEFLPEHNNQYKFFCRALSDFLRKPQIPIVILLIFVQKQREEFWSQ